MYWNTETTGFGDQPGLQQRGHTSTALQAPTAYTNTIYAGWAIDVDGDPSTDDDEPWVFGTTMDPAYPKLQWEGMIAADQTIAPTTRPASTAPLCAW